ncbi:UDP-glucuronic acid decarboxylase family protein [Siccirubricoccus phaeus]|uniref:UDP-glucuronic acid decarboxylase family protein n=1 Tax=Siccirubricoccus phaeus TaxID=2595053 RepID=UPI0011F1BCE4|nr:UDP-glucuronic acid decarboxylase family protein [Siccirubricoccus phaeus]
MRNGRHRTALVAGGAGFLGSHLCDALLAEGAEVICLDSFVTGRRQNLRHLARDPRFTLIEADITEPLPAALAARRPEAVFNLACAASPPHYQGDPEHTLLTCVLGTRNLLRLAESTGARFVQASTSEVYGDPEIHPQVESYWGHVNPTGPRACYDEGKRAAETLCFDYLRAGRADVRVARIFNTYGPRMRADDGRVVSNVVTQALAGADITLYGDGSQTRSFCYVSDLIDGLRRLGSLATPVPSAVNLGNPVELNVAQLVERVLALTGSRSAVVRRPLPADDPRRRRPDITLARRLLGWSPCVPLETGLRACIAWFEEEMRPGACRPSQAKDAAAEAPAVADLHRQPAEDASQRSRPRRMNQAEDARLVARPGR